MRVRYRKICFENGTAASAFGKFSRRVKTTGERNHSHDGTRGMAGGFQRNEKCSMADERLKFAAPHFLPERVERESRPAD
jgi:hypothetical protein